MIDIIILIAILKVILLNHIQCEVSVTILKDIENDIVIDM